MNQSTVPNGKTQALSSRLFRGLFILGLTAFSFIGGRWFAEKLIEKREPSLISVPKIPSRPNGLAAILDGAEEKPTPKFMDRGTPEGRIPGQYDKVFTEFLVEFSEGISALPQNRSLNFWFLLSDRPHDHLGPCISVRVALGDNEAMFHLENTLGDDARGLATHALGHASESIRDLLELEIDAGVPQSQKM